MLSALSHSSSASCARDKQLVPDVCAPGQESSRDLLARSAFSHPASCSNARDQGNCTAFPASTGLARSGWASAATVPVLAEGHLAPSNLAAVSACTHLHVKWTRLCEKFMVPRDSPRRRPCSRDRFIKERRMALAIAKTHWTVPQDEHCTIAHWQFPVTPLLLSR